MSDELRNMVAKTCREVINEDVGLTNKEMKNYVWDQFEQRVDKLISKALRDDKVEEIVNRKIEKMVLDRVSRIGQAHFRDQVKKKLEKTLKRINFEVKIK